MKYILNLIKGELAEIIWWPVDQKISFVAYKAAVFQNFTVEPEYFRKRFGVSTVYYAKSYVEFAFQLSNYFGKWIDHIANKD